MAVIILNLLLLKVDVSTHELTVLLDLFDDLFSVLLDELTQENVILDVREHGIIVALFRRGGIVAVVKVREDFGQGIGLLLGALLLEGWKFLMELLRHHVLGILAEVGVG